SPGSSWFATACTASACVNPYSAQRSVLPNGPARQSTCNGRRGAKKDATATRATVTVQPPETCQCTRWPSASAAAAAQTGHRSPETPGCNRTSSCSSVTSTSPLPSPSACGTEKTRAVSAPELCRSGTTRCTLVPAGTVIRSVTESTPSRSSFRFTTLESVSAAKVSCCAAAGAGSPNSKTARPASDPSLANTAQTIVRRG